MVWYIFLKFSFLEWTCMKVLQVLKETLCINHILYESVASVVIFYWKYNRWVALTLYIFIISIFERVFYAIEKELRV